MKKKITSLLLLASIFVSNCTFSLAAEEENVALEGSSSYEVLWDSDFETDADKPEREGPITYEKYDDEHGKSITMDSTTWPTFYKDFETPITDGILYISYDFLRTQSKARGGDSFLLEKNSTWGNGLYPLMKYPGDGRISYYADCHIDSILMPSPGNTIAQTNQWHKMETWLDLDSRVANLYLDGVLFGSTTVTEELTKISTFRHTVEQATDGTIEYFDNCKILHFEELGRELDFDFIAGMPDYLKSPVTINIEADVLAQSFYEKESSFKVSMANLIKSDINGKLNVSIIDENGRAVFKESRDVQLAAKAKGEEIISFSFGEYGAYTVKVSIEVSGYTDSVAQTKFMFIKKAERNKNLGFSSHSGWNYGTAELDRKQQVLGNAGFNIQREAMYWTDYVPQNGEMGIPERQQFIFGTSEKNEIDLLVMIDGWGGRTDLTEDAVPRSDWSRENFRKYVTGVATDMKGKARFYEIFNETHLVDDPDSYVAAQRIAYQAIKSVDPDAIVLCGATARVPLDWIEMLLERDAGKYFDAFSCHPYTIENLPEKGGRYGTSESMVKGLRDLLDKYGLQDKEIVISELSYTAANFYASETQQGAFGLRQYFMIQQYIDTYIWYNDQNKSAAGATEVEGNFGLLRSWQNDGINYQAKPALLAWAGYNSLLANGKNLGKVETENKDVWIYKFKATDGKDVIAIWNAENDKMPVSVNLGVDSAELYDMYGNKSMVYATNGRLNVEVSENITYLRGSFSQVSQHDADFLIEKNEVQIIQGEEFSIPIDKLPNIPGLEIVVDCPDNIKTQSVSNSEIVFISGFDNQESERITINFVSGGRTLFSHEVEVEYIEPIVYSYEFIPYNTQRYQAIIKLRNERNSDVTASLTISEPQSMAGKTYKVNTISSKDERTIKINIPIAEAEKGKVTIRGNIHVEGKTGSEDVPIEISRQLGNLKYDPAKKPTIDGVLSDGEWHEFLPININKKEMAQQKLWGGIDDLSGTVYTMCDDENLYLAAEVTDDIYYDKDTPERVWSNDSIQMAIALRRENGAPSTEIGLGISNGEQTLQSYLAQNVNGKAADTFEFSEDTLYSVKRYEEEKKTIYELQLPWDQIYADPIEISKQKNIYFSILINDHDGVSRGWLEYCGGIGNGKNPEQFMELPVYKIR